MTDKRDLISETLAGLAAIGRDRVPESIVGAAWRETLYPELESRVGKRLSAGLSDAQLTSFEVLLDADDNEGAARWLNTHVPRHPQIVAEESDRLIGEAVEWFARTSRTFIEEIG